MTEQRPGRGRPRRAEVDTQILDATAEVLRLHGPSAVNVETVAARSGVARTTIYRRYRDRRELLTAALNRITDRGVPPAHGEVADKLRWMLRQVRDVLEGGLGRGGVAAVLADADPEFTDALRTTLAGHLGPVMDAIADDAANGVLRPEVDPDTLINLAFGAYLAEQVRYGHQREDWLRRTTALLERAVIAD